MLHFHCKGPLLILACYVQNAVNIVEHTIGPRFLSPFPAVFQTDLTMLNGYILEENQEKSRSISNEITRTGRCNLIS